MMNYLLETQRRWDRAQLSLNMWLSLGWAQASVTEATASHAAFGTSREIGDRAGLCPGEQECWELLN